MVIELTAEEMLQLRAVAEATRRSETELAREAMRWFLASRDDDATSIERARDDIRAGRTIEHDELFQSIKSDLSV